ncbi:RHOMBOID-like 2 [Actinidia rufa]|uniref:RHOMBOID-like protein n=1 Tax=Actinidia rufa TaxID=165716 RepID=A0A7J0EAM4_9ERIC|nr:RHOMBOID-like 2 [Actinidia rufa]
MLGALERTKVVNEHQEWRLIACIWLHAGLVHMLANMLGLLFIGIRLEQQFGFLRIGIIYLLSGFGGSTLSSLFIDNSVSVGASGALLAFSVQCFWSLLPTGLSIATKLVVCKFWSAGYLSVHKVVKGFHNDLNFSTWPFSGFSALNTCCRRPINLGIGILSRVDNFAYIGGFLTGFLLVFVFAAPSSIGWMERLKLPADVSVRSKYKAYQYVLWLVSLVLLAAGFRVGLVMLFRGVNVIVATGVIT